jgi:hypothetical protein
MTDHPEITFNEDGEVVSIWTASFSSQAALDEFLCPFDSDSPETDEEPISAFAVDVGLSSYDEDFLESRLLETESDLATALAAASHSSSFAQAAGRSASAAQPFNTIILLYGYAHARYPQAAHRSEKVTFVGTFPYDGRA